MTASSLLEFPCRFPIKALGRETNGLDSLVLEIVRRHAPDTDSSQISRRSSSAGRYVSITVTIHARSQAQVDAIYRDLSAHEHILMAL